MSKSGFILLTAAIILQLIIAKKITCPKIDCEPKDYWIGTIRQDMCYSHDKK